MNMLNRMRCPVLRLSNLGILISLASIAFRTSHYKLRKYDCKKIASFVQIIRTFSSLLTLHGVNLSWQWCPPKYGPLSNLDL